VTTPVDRLEAAINVWREWALEPVELEAIEDATRALDELHEPDVPAKTESKEAA
jgi:hypothetical protein